MHVLLEWIQTCYSHVHVTCMYVLLACTTVRVIRTSTFYKPFMYIHNNVRTLMNKFSPKSLRRIILHNAMHKETISLQGAYSSDIINGYSK